MQYFISFCIFFFLRTPNEEKETLISTHDEDIIDNNVLRDMYLDTRQEICDRISQKDASPFRFLTLLNRVYFKGTFMY